MEKLFTRSPSSLSSFTKAKRDIALGLKRSPLLSWAYDKRRVEYLLLVPQDLRTADPSLSIELDMGQFGLAGATVLLNGRSPFVVPAPNNGWYTELHGFSWLRNLRAARTDRAQERAIEFTREWIENYSDQSGVIWEPEVAARRLISWLSHSNFILHKADRYWYEDMMYAIEQHIRFLSMSQKHATVGLPRLVSLIALVLAGLCVADYETFAKQNAKLLGNELDKQILPDGGHISRDNSVLVRILLDLLPLKQCFISRNLDAPQSLNDAIDRMMPMIHYMRLGDGLLSRFNGAGTTLPDTLSTAMAYDDVSSKPLKEAPYSKYYRLKKGNVILLMDGGAPPSLELTSRAHAGCLSFEMSSGTCPLIVNCGAAPPAYHTMANNARASVTHSTLTINNRSSGQFIHDKKVKSSDMPSLLTGPENVRVEYVREKDQIKLVGYQDGYLKRFGLIHHRMLSLSMDGYTLIGEDWIEAPDGGKGIQQNLGWPYAVHFHIHPDVKTTRARDGKALTLILPDSQEWQFRANNSLIYLEESTFYADFAGPCQSVQAVIRGNCVGDTRISWKLAKVVKVDATPEPKVPSWFSNAENVIPLGKASEDGSQDQQTEKREEEKEPALSKPVQKPLKDSEPSTDEQEDEVEEDIIAIDDDVTDLIEDLDEDEESEEEKPPKRPNSLQERLKLDAPDKTSLDDEGEDPETSD